MPFTPGREQDAFATIRGYVYQVHLTLWRWLHLDDAHTLELERGEDIDLVSKHVDQDPARLLEQVKDLSRTITLRDAGATFAMASFREHLRQNPALRLLFRFTTTASGGREKPSYIPKKEPGIYAWERLRSGAVSTADTPGVLTGIRKTLTDIARPAKLNVDVWNRFVAFCGTSNDTDLRAFVESFEWSTGSADNTDLKELIVARLAKDRGEGDGVPIAQVYNKLFVHLFDLLSTEGPKTLSSVGLAQILANPVLADAERARLATIEQVLAAHSTRLGALESRVGQLELGAAEMNALRMGAGVNAELLLKEELGDLTPPPLVERLCRREKTVADIVGQLVKRPWVALVGSYGLGKSQLARLVAERSDRQVSWLSFRHIDADAAARMLRMALRSDGTLFGANCLVVLDDLPPEGPDGQLARAIYQLIKHVAPTGCRLLSTGAQRTPGRLGEVLPSGTVLEQTVPPFSIDDAVELFKAHGAPPTFVDVDRFALINGACHQHPMLLVAAARHFAQRGWQWDANSFASLIQGDFAADLSTDTVRRLLDTVTSHTCRDLLYRLCVFGGRFPLTAIAMVAGVPPAHAAFAECTTALEGLWLQRVDASLFEVSPLVSGFGAKQVDADVARSVHRASADFILNRRSIDIVMMWQGLGHLISAEEHNRATSLLIWAHHNGPRDRSGRDRVGILALYPPAMELPSTLMPGLAMQLRAFQVSASLADSKDGRPFLQSLNALIAKATPADTWGVLMSSLHLIAFAHELAAADLMPFVRAVEACKGCAKGPTGDEIQVPLWASGEHFWIVTPSIRSWADLHAWLDMVESLPAVRRRLVETYGLGRDLIQSVVDRLWVASVEETPGAPTVAAVFEALRSLAVRAATSKWHLLYACAVRGQMTIAGEYQDHLADVPKLGTAATDILPREGSARFLIDLTMGQQFEFAGKHEESLPYLSSAAVNDRFASPINRVLLRLRFAEALDALDRSSAAYCEEALTILNSSEPHVADFRTRVEAAVAVARWKDGRPGDAFDLLEACLERLAKPNPTDEEKYLTVQIGHALGYIMTVAVEGRPPTTLRTGEAYAKPRLSAFRGFNRAALDYFRPRTGEVVLCAQLAAFAKALDKTNRAAFWAQRAIEGAVARGVPAAVSFTAPYAIQFLLEEKDDVAGALDVALKAGRSLIVLKGESAAGRDPAREDFQSNLAVPEPDASKRLDAEHAASTFFVIPMAVAAIGRWRRDPAAGTAYCLDAARIIRNHSSNSAIPAMWNAMAALLEYVANQEGQWDEGLRETMKDVPESMGMIRIAARLLLMLRADAPLNSIVGYQASVLRHVLAWHSLCAKTHRDKFATVLIEFWEERFVAGRFQFRNPGDVERSLSNAKALPATDRLKAAIRAVAAGLGVKFSEPLAAELKPSEVPPQ